MEGIEVRVDGNPFVTSRDWHRAQVAPKAELPEVDEEHRSPIRLRLSPEADRRREFAMSLATARMREEGEQLADILAKAIPARSNFDLRYVIWDGSRREWIAVPSRQEVRPVGVSMELANRLTGWGTQQDYDELAKLFVENGPKLESRSA